MTSNRVKEALDAFKNEFELQAQKMLDASSPEMLEKSWSQEEEDKHPRGHGGRFAPKGGDDEPVYSHEEIPLPGLTSDMLIDQEEREKYERSQGRGTKSPIDWPPAKVEPVEFEDVTPEAEKTLKRMGLTPQDFAQIYTGGIDRLGFDTYPLLMNIQGSADGNELILSGSISLKAVGDDDHTELVKFERSWRRDYARTPWVVHHDRLEVDDSLQGSGYGSTMFYRSEEAYRKLGVEHIEVDANIDIGGYAWARMGFDFQDSIGLRNVRNAVKNAFEQEQRDRYMDEDDPYAWQHLPEVKKQMADMEKQLDTMEHPYQFAAFHVKYNGKDIALGKKGMASTTCDWNGVKYLNPRDPDADPGTLKAGEIYKRTKMATLNEKSVASETGKIVGGIEAHFDINSPDDDEWAKQLREIDNSLYLDLDMAEKSEATPGSTADFAAEYPQPLNPIEGVSVGGGSKKKHEDEDDEPEEKSGTWEEDQHPRNNDGEFASEGGVAAHSFNNIDEADQWLDDMFKRAIPDEKAFIEDDERAEMHAAREYKGSAYSGINRLLRSGNKRQLESGGYGYGDMVKSLDRFIGRFTVDRDVVVHRTVYSTTMSQDDLSKFVSTILANKGGVFVDHGFVSTTAYSWSHVVTSGKAKQPAFLDIIVPKGSHAAPLDHFTDFLGPGSGEGELLLPRDSRFKVLDVDHSTKRVRLEYLPPKVDKSMLEVVQ